MQLYQFILKTNPKLKTKNTSNIFDPLSPGTCISAAHMSNNEDIKWPHEWQGTPFSIQKWDLPHYNSFCAKPCEVRWDFQSFPVLGVSENGNFPPFKGSLCCSSLLLLHGWDSVQQLWPSGIIRTSSLASLWWTKNSKSSFPFGTYQANWWVD